MVLLGFVRLTWASAGFEELGFFEQDMGGQNAGS